MADEDSNFDRAAPDEELHVFVNDLERPIGTYLYGRRMYEVMVSWETAHAQVDQPARLSGPGWSTSVTCSSRPSSWVVANNPFPMVSA